MYMLMHLMLFCSKLVDFKFVILIVFCTIVQTGGYSEDMIPTVSVIFMVHCFLLMHKLAAVEY